MQTQTDGFSVSVYITGTTAVPTADQAIAGRLNISRFCTGPQRDPFKCCGIGRRSNCTALDGNLPAALDKLNAAITAIAEPVKGWHADGVKLAPSLYEQLVCDVTAKAGERAGTFHRASTPPVYIDALMLRSDIDATVKAFDPAGTSTPDRLHRIASGRWRPQDAERLELLAADLERWTVAIKSLLELEHVKPGQCAVPGLWRDYRLPAEQDRGAGPPGRLADRRLDRLPLPGLQCPLAARAIPTAVQGAGLRHPGGRRRVVC